MSSSYSYKSLLDFSIALLVNAGLSDDRASVMAKAIIDADLMGHTTHGLALLPAYVDQLKNGGMKKEGEPVVLNDSGAALAWDGDYLPGHWLLQKAIDEALLRMANNPVVTITIQRAHHIGALSVYPERATEKGLMMLLSSNDPACKLVAPYGGVTPVYSPNPIAVGIPTHSDPIIADVSTSTTAFGTINRAKNEGKQLNHPWLMDGKGNPTTDPMETEATPPASILPLGGMDNGYKGYALGLMVEAMTAGLSGHGRKDEPTKWGCSVFLQIINPGAFAGADSFKSEMTAQAEQCKASVAIDESKPVRLPGERGFALKRKQLVEGVTLYPGISDGLIKCGEQYGLNLSA